MEIEWADGEKADISLEGLRTWCPCALCTDQRGQQERDQGLHMITPDEANASAEIKEVVSVGRYAIQIRWADGHDTGIYTYDYLYKLGEQTGE